MCFHIIMVMDLKKYLEEKMIIKRRFAQKIVELTNGEVTSEDLFKKREK